MASKLRKFLVPIFVLLQVIVNVADGIRCRFSLLSLFELAEVEAFECTEIIACVSRSDDPLSSGIVRNLGWCGFSLTSLDYWMPPGVGGGLALSDRWLFLAAQV